MSGQEGLGRVFISVPIASGVALNLSQASAIAFVCSGTDTFSLTIATTFAGTYRAGSFFTPAWTPITRLYTNTSAAGTGVFTKVTQAAADNTGSRANPVFQLFGSQVPDTYMYVKCTASGAGLVTAILHDLVVARQPSNLAKVSA